MDKMCMICRKKPAIALQKRLCRNCHFFYQDITHPDKRKVRLAKAVAYASIYRSQNPFASQKYHLAKNYGITMIERDRIFANGCEICGKLTNLTVDHCHITKKIRGCLCEEHNLALGHLGDTKEQIVLTLHKIEKYLSKETTQHG